MADASLVARHAEERARAIRELLAAPLLDVHREPERFGLVVRHHGWLADWFETACGWRLTVDIAAGFARLAKRSATPDPTRPLRRLRGNQAPFDRRRYQLLCLACAELVRRPVTTIGLLARAIATQADLDTSRYGERSAFVDALLTLGAWGVVKATAGEVETFLDDEHGNAILTADTARLHRLLAATGAPSSLVEDVTVGEATSELLAEPRYGNAAWDPGAVAEEQRFRWARHTLARHLLDDPVVHLDDLSPAERDYLASSSGRRWLRERVAEAGFELEERVEGLLAVDPDALATDIQFPAPLGHAHQLALLLIDRLVEVGPDGDRRVGVLGPTALRRHVTAVLAEHPGWARTHREGDGPVHLGEAAIDLLVAFGLVRREADGSVVGRPAVARYRVGEPVTTTAPPSLFEDAP